jgi:peptidoglycan/LPS O-acetylase OafA/YrhL
MNAPDTRYYGLDVLRFCAAASVFVFHYAINSAGSNAAPPDYPTASWWISEAGRYGIVGVHAFFVLSGFVIMATAMKTDAAGFFAGRFVRIMPVFAACALISMLAIGFGGRAQPSLTWYLANLTFVPQAFGLHWIDGVFWTLRYELQFYGFVFLLLVTGQLKRLAWPLTWVWLVISVINAAGFLPNVLRLIFVADYAPLFIAGLGLYWCVEKPAPARILMVVIATATAVAGEIGRVGLLEPEIYMTINRWVMCGLVASLPLIFLAALHARLERIGPVCYFLGGISYPLYLLHDNLSLVLMPRFGVWLGTTIIIAVASVVFVVDEKTRHHIRAALARILRRAFKAPERRSQQS